MNTVIVKYIFWILVSLPMLILGIVFVSNITGDIYNRAKEDKAARKLRESTAKRSESHSLEDSYRRKHSGGN